MIWISSITLGRKLELTVCFLLLRVIVSYAVMTKNTQLTMFIEDFVNVFTVVDCYSEWES